MLLAACASRPAQIGVDANYIVEVTNPSAHAMTVSADLGAGQMAVLGEVPAGGAKSFEIRDPSTNDIQIRATSSDNSHTVTRKVELKRGVVSRVTLN
jgi:hypothetical protein